MIKQLAHINIGSYDLDASEHFYCNILGMEKTLNSSKTANCTVFMLEQETQPLSKSLSRRMR